MDAPEPGIDAIASPIHASDRGHATDHDRRPPCRSGMPMIAGSDLLMFMAVVLGLFLVPGPAVLLVVARTAQGGKKTGVATGLGIAAGDLIHTLAASIGLSALFATSTLAFTVVKLAGAAYLVYLGVRAFLAKGGAARAATSVMSPARAFWQAIPAELLNPKTALFFLAFLPQFVHADRSAPLPQFIVLGLVLVAMSAVYTTLLVLAIGPLGRVLKRLPWLARLQGKIIGSIFIGLGVKVALQRQ